MKKVLTLAVVACMAFAMPAQAQIKIGAKAGLNLTSMSVDGSSSGLFNKAGFFLGPTLKVTVPVVGLSFDGSLLFDQRSAEVKGTNESIKSQSIQIPINVRYGIGLSSVVNLFAFAGPQFGFNIGSKNKTIIEDVQTWTLKSSNLSANFGIGATVLSKFQVTVNYNVALGKTGDYNIWNVAKSAWESVDGKANAWQLGAAYYF